MIHSLVSGSVHCQIQWHSCTMTEGNLFELHWIKMYFLIFKCYIMWGVANSNFNSWVEGDDLLSVGWPTLRICYTLVECYGGYGELKHILASLKSIQGKASRPTPLLACVLSTISINWSKRAEEWQSFWYLMHLDWWNYCCYHNCYYTRHSTLSLICFPNIYRSSSF